MRRIALLGVILALMAGCVTPEQIKGTSRQQGELLAEFQKTVGALRSKLMEYYDTRIEEFRQDLTDSKVRNEFPRVTAALKEALQELKANVPKKKKEDLIRKYLNQANNYLVQLPEIYFDEKYCEKLKRLQPEFLKAQAGECNEKHLEAYKKLQDARNKVAERFDQLAKTVADMEQAHALIDRFVQIEFKLTEERVDEAKKLIQEAKETIDDAKKGFEDFRRSGG